MVRWSALGLLWLACGRCVEAKTCVITISCWNNFAHVLSFFEAARDANRQVECFVWYVADRPEYYGASSSPLLREDHQDAMRLLEARVPRWVSVTTLDGLRPHSSFPPLEAAFKYSLVEFNVAIKAAAFRHAFDAMRATKCVYLDNDVWVLRGLGEIEALLDSYSVVITPHESEPSPLDGKTQTDTKIRQAGVYNFGFLALGDSASTRTFLRWWEQRLRWFAFDRRQEGLSFDQGWGDFIPAFFDHDDASLSSVEPSFGSRDLRGGRSSGVASRRSIDVRRPRGE